MSSTIFRKFKYICQSNSVNGAVNRARRTANLKPINFFSSPVVHLPAVLKIISKLLFHLDCKCRVNHNGCDLEVQLKGGIVKNGRTDRSHLIVDEHDFFVQKPVDVAKKRTLYEISIWEDN